MSTTATTRATSGYRMFFLVAALFDIALGVVFFTLYDQIFALLGMVLPNSVSYIHLTAAFVFVQGLGYWLVSRDPDGNLGIVKLGVAYKGMYVALAAYYLVTGQLVHAVFAWFALFDLLFLIGFVLFLRDAGRRRTG